MSDFAGLWRLDGKPVDGGDFNRLAQGLDGRGVASARFWRAGPVGLVHRQHGFTPEDGIERLPRVGASGAVLVADLRLNDRANLMRALDLPVVGAAYADGALLLHAVERWGTEAALARLYGDYAFAVWDPAGRRLTLARDPAGARALFVHRGERLIAFSTRLRALLALPEVPRDLDERAVADHLQCLPGRPSRTLYRAIDRVPMGHLAVLSREDTRLIRWWTLPQPGPSRSARDDEVEERARDVLDRAVADSLRSSQPVTLMLTGGLDSGAVVASAARQSAPSRITAFTRLPDGPVLPADARVYHDETPGARALAARHANVDWHVVGNDSGDWGENDARRWFLAGGAPPLKPMNLAWFFPIYRAMAARGSRVALCGDMGNAFYSFTGLTLLPELFSGLRWPSLLGHLRALSRTEAVGVARLFRRRVLAPLQPRWLRQLRRTSYPGPINPDFATEFQPEDGWMRGDGFASTMALRRQVWADELVHDTFGAARALSGIDWRSPLADRRVVEYFGSLPLDQFLRDGVTRSLARRLLAGQAPAETVANRLVGRQNGDWFARLTARRPSMLADMARLRASPFARRAVDLDRLQTLLDHWPTDQAAAEARRQDYFLILTQGIEMGRFLAWHEGGNR